MLRCAVRGNFEKLRQISKIKNINSMQCQRARQRAWPPPPLSLYRPWHPWHLTVNRQPSAEPSSRHRAVEAEDAVALLFGLKHFYFECLSLKYTPAECVCDKYTHTQTRWQQLWRGCPLDGILHNYSSVVVVVVVVHVDNACGLSAACCVPVCIYFFCLCVCNKP